MLLKNNLSQALTVQFARMAITSVMLLEKRHNITPLQQGWKGPPEFILSIYSKDNLSSQHCLCIKVLSYSYQKMHLSHKVFTTRTSQVKHFCLIKQVFESITYHFGLLVDFTIGAIPSL